VAGYFLYFLSFELPWSLLSSTPKNEEVFHRILRRGCKAVGPGALVNISIQLLPPVASLATMCGKILIEKKCSLSTRVGIAIQQILSSGNRSLLWMAKKFEGAMM
jgi:hypothetical protein